VVDGCGQNSRFNGFFAVSKAAEAADATNAREVTGLKPGANESANERKTCHHDFEDTRKSAALSPQTRRGKFSPAGKINQPGEHDQDQHDKHDRRLAHLLLMPGKTRFSAVFKHGFVP
jgi:hypothetical protein